MGHHGKAWYLKTRNELIDELADKRARIEELEAQLEGMVPRAEYEEEVKAKEAHRDGMAALDKRLADARAEIEELRRKAVWR